jgi:iron complex transport system substrate-binding protein
MKLLPTHVKSVFISLALVLLATGSSPGENVWAAEARLDNQTIIDQAGRKLAVAKPFGRIISLYGAHTENLFSLDAGSQVIGVSKNEVHPPEALKKPVFSYRDDPEKFLAARPDLVLIRPMIGRGYPQLVERLEASGITVVSLQPSSVDQLRIYWKILGVLTGRQQQAAAMIAHFDDAVAEFSSIANAVQSKKRVYFEAIHSKMKTFAPGSMAIFVLQTAGGINIAADAEPVRQTNIAAYGKERILSHADRIDVYLAQFGEMNQPTVDIIRNEPGFSAIRAVRNDEIYLIDEMIVSRPTLRLLDGVQEIGSRLYPEIFTRNVINNTGN